jgi:hypothetical protein
LREEGLTDKPLSILVPATEMDPAFVAELIQEFSQSVSGAELAARVGARGVVKVLLGANVGFIESESQVVLRFAGKDLITISRAPGGLCIDAKFFDTSAKLVAQLRRNRFSLNENDVFKVIGPDAHTLYVTDIAGLEILNVRFINARTIRVRGIFQYGNRLTLDAMQDPAMHGDTPWMTRCLAADSGGSLFTVP